MTLNGYPGNGGYPPAGVQQGFDGRNLPQNKQVFWAAGSKQEVAVSMNANHGGGYSYRLCPKPGTFEELTEECFQKHHLSFAGDVQWVQWGDNKQSRKEVQAVRVSEGTYPHGSQWTRFPIPACGGNLGGDGAGGSMVPGRIQAGAECNTSQFEPPVPGLYGFGLTQCFYPNTDISVAAVAHAHSHLPYRNCTDKDIKDVKKLFNVNIVDLVEVPSNLTPGEYVLSWRHDSEQTPQIWATCADITVTANATLMV